MKTTFQACALAVLAALPAAGTAAAQEPQAPARETRRDDERIASQIADEIRGSVHFDIFDWVEGEHRLTAPWPFIVSYVLVTDLPVRTGLIES